MGKKKESIDELANILVSLRPYIKVSDICDRLVRIENIEVIEVWKVRVFDKLTARIYEEAESPSEWNKQEFTILGRGKNYDQMYYELCKKLLVYGVVDPYKVSKEIKRYKGVVSNLEKFSDLIRLSDLTL